MTEVLKELQDTKLDLIHTISSISEDRFNVVPFEDSWTAAQVSEHILKAIGTDVLYGKTQPTNRDPGEKIAETGKLFLDMSIKMKNPDFLLPSGKKHTKAEILADVESALSRLAEAAGTLDLSATCISFEIPGFGKFTRLEFVWFFIFHTQRHINQLKNIANILAN